jgi:chromate reductase, NAD(P)H dehydrogenase (quinone)
MFLNVPRMPQPEAYIGNAANLFDESSKLINDSTRAFAAKYMQAFVAWVEANTCGGKP